MGITKEQLEGYVTEERYVINPRVGTMMCTLFLKNGYRVKGSAPYLGGTPTLVAMARSGARLRALTQLRELLSFHQAEVGAFILGSKT